MQWVQRSPFSADEQEVEIFTGSPPQVAEDIQARVAKYAVRVVSMVHLPPSNTVVVFEEER